MNLYFNKNNSLNYLVLNIYKDLKKKYNFNSSNTKSILKLLCSKYETFLPDKYNNFSYHIIAELVKEIKFDVKDDKYISSFSIFFHILYIEDFVIHKHKKLYTKKGK